MSEELELWSDAPASVELGEDEAHVWCASLEPSRARAEFCARMLAPDERARAARFHFERDRVHFTVARAVLRDVLARYLGCEPRSLGFSYNSYGKPELARGDAELPTSAGAWPDTLRFGKDERPGLRSGDDGHKGLRFNVSHAHGMALYALTRGRELGVDLEWMREDFASLEIARNFFSRAEVERLQALPPEERTRGFFNCWTRKEAYIKALGEGLSHPLDCFAVSLAPGEPARFLWIENDPQEIERWSMFALCPPEENYAAALVLEGRVRRLRLWRHAWR